jgi:serine/threonine-protein kinase
MIGARLGKWVIDKELGRGGMGRVYLAHDEGNGGLAAVKILARELAQETGFQQRFQREIDALSQLSHPNIVRFYDSGAQDQILFYAMEYIQGPSFEELLHAQGRLPWPEVLDAALQICPALKHAHDRGIIHRDIKPPNLLRSPEGVVKLTDFGVAKVFASNQLTSTGGIVGTAEYLSPEQAGGKPVTKRSDLYSLGVVLYTLLTGRTPFEGETIVELLHKHRFAQFDRVHKLVPDVPYELDEIISQLLEKDPARRPADGLILQRQLDSLRRKLDRKGNATLFAGRADATLADNQPAKPASQRGPGPATLMSRLMRQELEQENRGGWLKQLLNRPLVLVTLFLLCVGVIVWRLWPTHTPDPEELFARGAELMSSRDSADWDRAWKEYLEPLNRDYPDHPHRQQVQEFRQMLDDHTTQQRALAGLKTTGPASEAQRFYLRGLNQCRQGDPESARQIWQNLVRSFEGCESERRWVGLARDGLAALAASVPTEGRQASVREALRRARQLRDEGKTQQAGEIWQGLEALYRDDPAMAEVLQQVRRDRGS